MKTWARAKLERRCGFCGNSIAVGEPFLERWIAGHGWKKVRCIKCAGELAPDDLPLLMPRLIAAVPMTPIAPMRPVRGLALDWKQRQAEREPGEDG